MTTVIAIVIVITFNVIVIAIGYIVNLFIRNRAGGKFVIDYICAVIAPYLVVDKCRKPRVRVRRIANIRFYPRFHKQSIISNSAQFTSHYNKIR